MMQIHITWCLNSINENTLERLAKISRVWNKCVWVDGIREKNTLSNVIHIFSYSSIIYWLCQESITPPPPKLIQGFWENPLHRVCQKIEFKSAFLSESELLNQPKFFSSSSSPSSLFSFHPASGRSAVTTLQFIEESPLDECVSVQDAFGSRTVKMWGGMSTWMLIHNLCAVLFSLFTTAWARASVIEQVNTWLT